MSNTFSFTDFLEHDVCKAIENANLIIDSEFDDSMMVRLLQGVGIKISAEDILVIRTLSKDGNGLMKKKNTLFKELTDINLEKSLTVWESMVPTLKVTYFQQYLMRVIKKTAHLNYIPFILTAPTFGMMKILVSAFRNYTKKPIVVFLYSGEYNVANSPELQELANKTPGFHIVDCSRFYIMTSVKNKREPELSKSFYRALDPVFWKTMRKDQTRRTEVIEDFLRNFNKALIEPSRLFKETNFKEYELFCRLYKQNFPEYLKMIRQEKYNEKIKDKKRCIAYGLEHEAPMCDVTIAWLYYLTKFSHIHGMKANFTVGQWKVNKFTYVDPNTKPLNLGANWKASDPEKWANYIVPITKECLLRN